MAQTIAQIIAEIRTKNPAPANRDKTPIVGDQITFRYSGKDRKGVIAEILDNGTWKVRHTDGANKYRDENDRPKKWSSYRPELAEKVDYDCMETDYHTS
ncbi:MAG: hypothetical protein GY915_01995 [bacterium]|nr:hypothetical protein [bacterium]